MLEHRAVVDGWFLLAATLLSGIVGVLPTGSAFAARDQASGLIAVENATPDRTVAGLAPGDSVSLAFTVRNIAREPVSIQVDLQVEGGHPLLLDARVGLTVQMDGCSRPWTALSDRTTGNPVYRCDGTARRVFGPLPLGSIPEDFELSLPALAPGTAASYRGIATLSPEADNRLESARLGDWRLVAVATAGEEEQTEVVGAVLSAAQPGAGTEAARPVNTLVNRNPLWPALIGIGLLVGFGGLLFVLLHRRR